MKEPPTLGCLQVATPNHYRYTRSASLSQSVAAGRPLPPTKRRPSSVGPEMGPFFETQDGELNNENVFKLYSISWICGKNYFTLVNSVFGEKRVKAFFFE